MSTVLLVSNDNPTLHGYFFRFIVEEGELFGETRDRSMLLDDTVVVLPLDQLRQVYELT